MKLETIDFKIENNVGHITLNRPDAGNALNLQLATDLAAVALECDESPEVRAVLLTGEGRFFCVGGDIKAFATASHAPTLLKQITAQLHAALSRFARMEAPVIMAVNGAAAGAGLSLAASGDLVYAADNVKFTSAYTASALSPDGSSTYYLPRRIGDARTREMFLTNRAILADEALSWGLINYVTTAESLLDDATQMAEQLAHGATKAFGTVKSLMNDCYNNGLETQMEIEARGIAACAGSEDFKEGLDAFLNKRKPVFTGK